MLGRLFPGEPLTVTLLPPDALRRKPQRGRVWLASWQWLAHWTNCPAVCDNKADEGGIVLADLDGGVRRATSVRAVTALVLDHDAGTVRPTTAHAELAEYRHVIHTSASHTPEAPRWRAYIALSRTIAPAEYGPIWRRAADVVTSSGIPVDRSAADPCRLWYSPTIRTPASPFEHFAGEGRPLDVDRMLAQALADEAEIERSRKKPPPPQHDDRYAAGALRRAAAAVTGATTGDRHHTLCQQAYSLARLPQLTDSAIVDALMPAWRSAAGDSRAREGERTIADAISARKGGQ
jgi:hypothetical protein